MFQTEVIRFIQSIQSPEINFLMKAITALGYKEFLVFLLIIIFTGVDFKKGFLLMQVVIITGLVTEFLKNTFALPRPWFVDSSLEIFGKNFQDIQRFQGTGSETFWGFLNSEVIESYRNLKPDSYGLPSGHTSSAVVLWGTMICLFKNKWIRIISVLLILLIPFSRIYLARHFPVDVLGGYLVGGVILLIFYFTILNPKSLAKFLESKSFIVYMRIMKDVLLLLYLFFLPLVFYFLVPLKFVEMCGYLTGLNAAFLLITIRDYPSSKTTVPKRILRILVTLLIFFIIGALITILTNYLFAGEIKIVFFLRGFIIIFLGIILSEIFMRLLGLSGSRRH